MQLGTKEAPAEVMDFCRLMTLETDELEPLLAEQQHPKVWPTMQIHCTTFSKQPAMSDSVQKTLRFK